MSSVKVNLFKILNEIVINMKDYIVKAHILQCDVKSSILLTETVTKRNKEYFIKKTSEI